MASEPEAFDCGTCEHRQQLDGLDAENADAWRFYARLRGHRWVWDMDAGAWWLDALCRGMDEDDRDVLFARVNVIHDTLHPPKSP